MIDITQREPDKQAPLPLALVTTIAAGAATAVVPVVTNSAYKCISEAMSVMTIKDKIGAAITFAIIAAIVLAIIKPDWFDTPDSHCP